MSVQKGDVVLLQIGGVTVGALIGNDLNTFADMLDKSNKDLPGVKQYEAGEDGWTLSLEALFDPAATEGLSEALGYLKAGTLLSILYGIPTGGYWTGSAMVSSIDLSGPKNEISSYSLELQGTDVIDNLGPELHTDANAASDPNGNEADAVTGWTPTGLSGTGANVFESQSAVKNNGAYALHADANDTPTAGANFQANITVETSETYRITGVWRHIGSGDDWRLRVESVTKATITSAETTFAAFSVDVVAGDTSMAVQFGETGPNNNGGIYLDNLSVRKIL